MTPKISVIVPVYKVEQYLDKCVSSIVNQTYKNLEIILVNDGSPDSCPQMCDAWAKKDGRIKVIHKQNGGVSSARNVGIDASSGDYITFVDSDDYLLPDLYEKLLAKAEQTGSQITACNFYYFQEKTTYKAGTYVGDDKISLLFGKEVYSVFNKLYTRDIIKSNSLKFDESIKIAEDMYFNYCAFKCANSVSVIEDALYHYVERQGSAISSINIDWINRWHIFKATVDADGGDNCNKECFDVYAQTLLDASKDTIRLGDKQVINTTAIEIIKEINKNKARMKASPLSVTNRVMVALSSMPRVYILFYRVVYKIICKFVLK